MIKYLDGINYNDVSSKCPQVIDFCQKSGVGVSALGPFLSYGTAFDFADAWVQYDDEGLITAFILKFYGNVTVVTCEKSDAEEIREFLGIIGYSSLLSERCDIFPVPPVKTGCIMGLESGALCKAVTTKEEFSITDGEIFDLEDYRAFYSVLMKNNPGYICTSSDDFILDFSLVFIRLLRRLIIVLERIFGRLLTMRIRLSVWLSYQTASFVWLISA